MTREEAIKELQLIAKITMWNDRREAVEMAIEALSADRPKGEWEDRYINDADIFFKHRFYCNQCGNWNTFGRCDFCPHCGADMRGEKHGTTGDVPDAED